MERVLVVGAGVIGLSCAVRLLEAGVRVDVLARDLPEETTSAVAAAIWYPYLAFPRDRVTAWSATTFTALAALAGEAGTGVRMCPGTEVMRSPTPDPWWREAVPDLRRSVPPDGWADAWSLTVPVVEMPLYLGWLAGRVRALGGTLTRLSMPVLPRGTVVNCSGLGARVLAGDLSVGPVRGQVLSLGQVGLETWWLDDAAPTYVVPREHDIVVGGTAVAGEWSRTPDPVVADAVLARATELVPEIADAPVLAHRVGLRPARPEIRLERCGDVVHCYGHGGAGVTLSWGCADEVVALLGA